MAKLVSRFIFEESGATAIEYSLIAVLISVAIIAAVTMMSGSIGTLFNYIGNTAGNAIKDAPV
jgi:pilus assembly protein Flp/PilA